MREERPGKEGVKEYGGKPPNSHFNSESCLPSENIRVQIKWDPLETKTIGPSVPPSHRMELSREELDLHSDEQ